MPRRNRRHASRISCILIAATVSVISPLASQAIAGSQLHALMEIARGAKALSQGDLHAASEAFCTAADLSPNLPDALYACGITQLELGQANAALPMLKAYLALAPKTDPERPYIDAVVHALAKGLPPPTRN